MVVWAYLAWTDCDYAWDGEWGVGLVVGGGCACVRKLQTYERTDCDVWGGCWHHVGFVGGGGGCWGEEEGEG